MPAALDNPAPSRACSDFLANGLDRVARRMKAAGVAYWRLQAPASSAPAPALASSPAPALALEYARDFRAPPGCTAAAWQAFVRQGLARCVAQARPARASRPATAAPGTTLGNEGLELVFVPAREEGGRVVGVAAFAGPAEFARLYDIHAVLVGDSVALIAAGAAESARPVPGVAAAESQALQADGAATLAVALLSAPHAEAAARVAADTLREQLAAYRVSIFERRGAGWRLLAVSGVFAPDRHAAASRELRDRFERSLAGEASAPGWIAGDLARWQEGAAARQIGVAIELGDSGLAPVAAESVVRRSAALIAHALHLRRPLWRRGTLGASSRAGRTVAVVIGLIVIALLLRPVPHVFAGRCELLPAARGVAVAESRGRIVEILVTEGETVKAGQALIRLDSAEAASRLEIARQGLRRGEAEARRWQQEQNMSRLRAAQIDQRRAQEEVAKLEEDIRRATLTAPLDGVVLTKDLALRRGEVVEPGAILCEVASLATWDLQIEVDEADVGRLEDALTRRGALPIRYALHARSDLALEATLAATREVSQMAYPTERGAQVVFVTLRGVALPPELAADMRPGFSGLAKIEGAKEPFVVVAFSRLAQFIRLRVLL